MFREIFQTLQRWHFAAFLLAFLVCVAPASAQKKKNGTNPAADINSGIDNNATVPIPTTDNNAIDVEISEMLGAWQIGDADRMHKYYADDVVIVSGAYEPPISGWNAYLRSYQALRGRMQGARMDRYNTAIKVTGNSAWATYQWEFAGIVDGAQASFHGHTTLVFEKRDGKWMIVLNHTSMVEPANAAVHPVAQPQRQ